MRSVCEVRDGVHKVPLDIFMKKMSLDIRLDNWENLQAPNQWRAKNTLIGYLRILLLDSASSIDIYEKYLDRAYESSPPELQETVWEHVRRGTHLEGLASGCRVIRTGFEREVDDEIISI